jgi:hypothetical protein
MSERVMITGLYTFGVAHFVFAISGVVIPVIYYDTMANFGLRNDFFVRAVSFLDLALGVGALVSIRRVSWRLPVLTIGTIHWSLHGLSHYIDVDRAEPAWTGPFDVAVIGTGAVIGLIWTVGAWRDERRARSAVAVAQREPLPELRA